MSVSTGGDCDVKGEHAVKCSTLGSKTRRHHELVHIVEHAAKAALMQPERETPGLLPGNERPADLLTNEVGHRVASDFFVVHTPTTAVNSVEYLKTYATGQKETKYTE